ncbi:MAG TPA: ABC transporter permease [Longimicrobiales bacterium]|nr:ABC transporter permease [Longimicrobiales bacterium]
MSVYERWREWRESRAEQNAVVEEMQFHVEQETARNIRMGMTPREARRAALTAFGGVDRFAEAARDERPGTRWTEFRMSYLDWKLGARMLVKHKGMSLIGGITLAVAIGLGAGWFEMTMMMFYPDLPLEDGDRIIRIEYWNPATLDPERRTMHEFVQWREELTTIEQVGAHRTNPRNLMVAGAPPHVVRVAEISSSAFEVTGVPPVLGRPLIAADEAQEAGDVVVIGHAAWQRHFDGDRSIIGREIQLGRTRATIVGVMPDGYGFPSNHQFWMPLRPVQAEPLGGGAIEVFGKLRAGTTLERARAELATWGARMAQTSPATHERLQLNVHPFAGSSELTARREVFFINLFAWLILAVACANVAALMFARTALRESEIVVRNALGASRARVMGQLFIEALVLTSVAAVVGLLAAKAVIGYVLRLGFERETTPPFWWNSDIEPITVLYTALLAIAGAGIVGLLPALRATGRHVRDGLAHMGSGGSSLRFGRTWSAIIVLQVAFSVVCLPFGIAAGTEAYKQHRLRAAYNADPFLTLRPALDMETDVAAQEADAHMNRIVDELSRQLVNEPDVGGVAVARALPGTYDPLHRIEVQRGAEPPVIVDANTEGDRVRVGAVGPGFFTTFDLPLIAGREFTQSDIDAGGGVVVVNEAMARNIGGNVLGAYVRLAAVGEQEPGPWQDVVGVASNFGLTPTGDGEADYMYMPVAAADAGYVVVRVNGDARAFVPRLQILAARIDPELRLHDVLTLDEVIRRMDESMVSATLIGIGIVLLAIMLSAASLYALMAVAVALRTREIGIRVAIGAGRRAVLFSLFRRAATQVGIGIVVGNIVVGLVLVAMLEEVQPRAVLPPMVLASIVMLLVGVGACLVPGRRALRIQPTEALKEA